MMDDSGHGIGHYERVLGPWVQNVPSDEGAADIRSGAQGGGKLVQKRDWVAGGFAPQYENRERGRAGDGLKPGAIWQLEPQISAAVAERRRDACDSRQS